MAGRPLSSRPAIAGAALDRLAPGTERLGRFDGSGAKEASYLLRRPDGQVVAVSRLLYVVAAHLDGRHSAEMVAAAVTSELGRHVSAANVEFLVEHKLRPVGLLAGGPADGARAASRPLTGLGMRRALVPERLVGGATSALQGLFHPGAVLVALAMLIGLDAWLLFSHGVGGALHDVVASPVTLLVVAGFTVVSGAFHELGHASACRYGGARPGTIGVGVHLVWPAFYSDVTDSYRLGRAARVRCDLGGVYFNALFTVAVASLYLTTGFEPLVAVIVVQHLLVLEQFIPFLRLDGYYVIADLTGVPDLFHRIGPVLRSLVPGRAVEAGAAELRPSARAAVTAWVIVTVPLLVAGASVLVVRSPGLLGAGWDALFAHGTALGRAVTAGDAAAGASSAGQMVVLGLPLVGLVVLLARLGARTGGSLWRRARLRPAGAGPGPRRP